MSYSLALDELVDEFLVEFEVLYDEFEVFDEPDDEFEVFDVFEAELEELLNVIVEPCGTTSPAAGEVDSIVSVVVPEYEILNPNEFRT